jgi:serine/threonine-protein kinase haspin
MDDPIHGVTVTIIDLGLSRMDNDDHDTALWTVFDEEVFMGDGDYQFDVYRMMRNHTLGAWQDFKPLTNVMVCYASCTFSPVLTYTLVASLSGS